jgi:hypothetical protein
MITPDLQNQLATLLSKIGGIAPHLWDVAVQHQINSAQMYAPWLYWGMFIVGIIAVIFFIFMFVEGFMILGVIIFGLSFILLCQSYIDNNLTLKNPEYYAIKDLARMVKQ